MTYSPECVVETFSDLMERLDAKPVPREQIEKFERAMREQVIPEIEAYQREQARLAAITRRRIVF